MRRTATGSFVFEQQSLQPNCHSQNILTLCGHRSARDYCIPPCGGRTRTNVLTQTRSRNTRSVLHERLVHGTSERISCDPSINFLLTLERFELFCIGPKRRPTRSSDVTVTFVYIFQEGCRTESLRRRRRRKFIYQKGWLTERASAHQRWLPYTQ